MNKQEIEILIKQKENQITNLRKEIIKLKRQLMPLNTGLNEGDIVINNNGEKGVICYYGNETYWWGVRKIKKDGTPSKLIRRAYGEWKKIN